MTELVFLPKEKCPECDFAPLHGPSFDWLGQSCPECGWMTYKPILKDVEEYPDEEPVVGGRLDDLDQDAR